MKKKVALLVAHLGGGGAERVTVILANQFSKKYETHLIVFDDCYSEYTVEEEVQIHVLPQRGKKARLIPQKIFALREILQNISPDYVISLGFSYKYLFAGHLMSRYNFILSERNDPLQMYGKIELSIVKYCLNRAKCVVFQTEWAKSLFSKKIQEKSVVIPNPLSELNVPTYNSVREKRVVAYSRLTKQKNIPMMLRAFKKFENDNPGYCLEIYGRGEIENDLREYARQLDLDGKVHFMGFHKSVHEMINGAAMYVSSSDYEGISNSMIEAMALGLPTICTDCPVGGASMFITNKKNGLLVPVGDEEALAKSMQWIVDNPDLAACMGMEAQKIKQRLSINTITIEWERLLQ